MAEDKILIGNVTIENFLIFIFVFVLTLFLGNLVYALIRRFLDYRISQRGSKITARVTQYVVFVLGLYYGVYHILGLDLTAFVASLGIISIAIAFSSQQIIQNFMAGILVSIQRPIQIEEWVEVGGLPQTGMGKVKDIKLTHTTLKDKEGKLIYIPNSLLMSSKVINYTRGGFIEIPIKLTIPCNSDYEKIRAVILDVANESPRILPNVPREEKSIITKLFKLPHIQKLFEKKQDMEIFKPRVLISEISDSKITLSTRVWIREINKRDEIVSEFLDSLLKKIRDERIELAP